MARDYKRAATKKQKKKPVPGWLYFTTGLSIGLFVTMLVYLQLRGNTNPSSQTNEIESEQLADPEMEHDKVPVEEEQVQEEVDSADEEKGPRFDFYTILPELEVIIPDNEIRQDEEAPKIIDKSFVSKKKGEFVLQAGSFKTRKQADQRRAQLTLLGVHASIQRVTINENEIWYRVRIGPSNDLKQLDRIRSKLYKNNITAIPLRVRPD